MRPPFVLLTPDLRFCVALVAVALLAAGCATRRPAPVEDRVITRPPAQTVMAPPGAEAAHPVERAVSTYTVKRGDTLHQIALDTGLDYRELAAWNNIENVNRIFPGQVLRLSAPGTTVANAPEESPAGVTTSPLRAPPAVTEATPLAPPPAPPTSPVAPAVTPATPSPAVGSNVKTSPKAIREPYSERAVRELNLAASAVPAPAGAMPSPATAGGGGADIKAEVRAAPSASANPAHVPAPSIPSTGAPATPAAPGGSATGAAGDAERLEWAWPAKGKIIAGFSETANLKGIDIAGNAGDPVRASAPGRVVYAGTGLRGYGKLIIIKHNATYLSAYAHNREILVKEGQQVTRGQKIAEMGNTDADQVKLHFEIRRLGKPMDPAKYLP